jgi:hypothetical protein
VVLGFVGTHSGRAPVIAPSGDVAGIDHAGGMSSPAPLVDARLRAHRLTAPAATPLEAAEHLLAVQAQEFWGGRWALAVRSRGGGTGSSGTGSNGLQSGEDAAPPTLSDVDAAFDRGDLVRAWTMRGTIHVIPARDLGWVLQLTGQRQSRQASAMYRRHGLDAAALAEAQRVVTAALAGGNRLTREQLFGVLSGAGIDATDRRHAHIVYELAVRGVLCQGPVVARDGAPTREQYFVLSGEWIGGSAAPADPLAELFVRYITGHGPASAADFAWWSGLPATVARRAAAASVDRLVEVDDGVYTAATLPASDPAAPRVIALPSFDEYYISYADRTTVAAPELAALVGPGKNGLVRPILIEDGAVVGAWAHSKAVGRHGDAPVPDLAEGAATSPADVEAALARYARFIAG